MWLHKNVVTACRSAPQPKRKCSGGRVCNSDKIYVEKIQRRFDVPLAWNKDVVVKTLGALGASLSLHLFLDIDLIANAQSLPEQAKEYQVVDMDVYARLPPLPTKFPDLGPLPQAKFKKLKLKNGMRVIMAEDHEVPFVRGILSIKGGMRLNPGSNPALATLSAAVQRAGGSKLNSEEVFDRELEKLSAAIEGGASSEAVTFGFSSLKEDADSVIGLLSEIIKSPSMPQSKLDFFKKNVANSLVHKNDNPTAIPAREVSKLIYGKDSVYVVEPSVEQVLSTSVEDIAEWARSSELPENTVLGLVGDFNPKDMEAIVKSCFEDWESAGEEYRVPNPGIPNQEAIQGKIFIVNQPGLDQSAIAVAEPGVAIMDPDEAELGVLSGILNSFGGSLFDDIRSKRGLAYSVQAGWTSAPIDHPGLFMATAETDKPGQLLRSLRMLMDQSTTRRPDLDSVSRAKEEVLNSFVFGFSSQQNLLRRAVIFDLFGIPDSYIYQYRDKIKKVDAEGVKAAAARHVHPDKWVTVIIGDAARLMPEMSREFPDATIEPLRLDDYGPV
eukprot:jgi/Picsp_1/6120/NSC_03474-R1_peptidase m16-like protein